MSVIIKKIQAITGLMVKYKRLQNADNPTGKYQEEAGYTFAPLYV